MPTSPSLQPPGLPHSATLPGTSLHWFVPKAIVSSLPARLGARRSAWASSSSSSRAQAPDPCLGGELLGAGWEQGPVGRGWVLWFTHRPCIIIAAVLGFNNLRLPRSRVTFSIFSPGPGGGECCDDGSPGCFSFKSSK